MDPYFIIVASIAMIAGILIGWSVGFKAGVLAATLFFEGHQEEHREGRTSTTR